MCLHTGKCETVSTPSSDVQLSESSASDLTISLTQSELEEDLPEESERNDTYAWSDDLNQNSPESPLHSHTSKNKRHMNSESSAPVVTLER